MHLSCSRQLPLESRKRSNLRNQSCLRCRDSLVEAACIPIWRGKDNPAGALPPRTTSCATLKRESRLKNWGQLQREERRLLIPAHNQLRHSEASSRKGLAGGHRGRIVRLLAPVAAISFLASGCGNGASSVPQSANAFFTLVPGTATIDTNCTGCNATKSHGAAFLQFSAHLPDGTPADVVWSLSGGDPVAGAGTITAAGTYSPPGYLTADRVQVVATAALKEHPNIQASSVLTVTPGFQQPLTPEGIALGPGGSVTVTGTLAEAGGGAVIHFSLASTPSGTSGGAGSLSTPLCQRATKTFTTCSVTYSAPAAITATGVTYIIATAGADGARAEMAILLNAEGVTSNPFSHQGQLAAPIALGSSGGNNNDFDRRGNAVVDCCSGTLGSLLQDKSGRQFLLSNNHILALSDHASPGDTIVQPGLIDNNCTPNGDGPGTIPVASLTAWPPLRASSTNVDAAIAQVASQTVNPTGSILELGAKLPDGSLAAAPPGISSSGGRGETPSLQMRVAKSGRTTGLTCGSVSVVALDVAVDYFSDCAETKPYLTKLFTNQIGISGSRFSDAGDSGALVVDAEDAEPVGLYFAGGTDANGVVQGVANPANEVLSELSVPPVNPPLSFAGGPDHPVSCLSYGDHTIAGAQARSLSDGEIARVQQALAIARQWVNPSTGVLGVAMGKSNDRPGEGAVLVYVEPDSKPAIAPVVGGVRTVVIPTTPRAVALGAAPMSVALENEPPLSAPALSHALTVKHEEAAALMREHHEFFGLGVGQSLDNPREAALIIYVERRHLPAVLPVTVSGIRTRYIVMDRLHVTRSYAAPTETQDHCARLAPGRNAAARSPNLQRTEMR